MKTSRAFLLITLLRNKLEEKKVQLLNQFFKDFLYKYGVTNGIIREIKVKSLASDISCKSE